MCVVWCFHEGIAIRYSESDGYCIHHFFAIALTGVTSALPGGFTLLLILRKRLSVFHLNCDLPFFAFLESYHLFV